MKYILTYEGYQQYKVRIKHRRKRKKWEKMNGNRIDRGKNFGWNDPVSAAGTISRLDSL